MLREFIAATVFGTMMIAGAQAADLGGQVLKIGSDTTYPPMETVDEKTGEIVGFDVDIMDAICAKINCKAEFVTTAWDGIFAALVQGEFDVVMSGVSITDERKKTMDFSDPYLVVSQAILLRVEDEGTSLDAFQNGSKTLAAQTGTTNAQLAEKLVTRDNTRLYDTFAAAILALQNADVDGVIIDGTSAHAYEQEFAGELTAAIKGLESDPLGIVFQKGSPMVDAFNEGLEQIKADGTWDALVAKYWGVEN
ncbi:amino acid ABC transporter substrate-binding protein, PAAT family [Pseudovibrio denitrificans]|uniref:Amino acid ABC transporter substrate-binding protein, PAAT family n=1 Tax=Pseudovibrio denitrificans TaxID=258256 RepID=A0A1I7BM89_9HYPH|nr:basic amino acid ABC transporter substrate-binding protein [Pseudovibrio denitrificans]SFT88279.1 amino acid ABC transporter substrate-binding protein, PAAT family [Pseudovibrio denitrificans]